MASDLYTVRVEGIRGATVSLRVTDAIYPHDDVHCAPPLSVAFFVMAANEVAGPRGRASALRVQLVSMKACDNDGVLLSERALSSAAKKLVHSAKLLEVPARNQGVYELTFTDEASVAHLREGSTFKTASYDVGPSTFKSTWAKLAPPAPPARQATTTSDETSIRVLSFADGIVGVDRLHPRRASLVVDHGFIGHALRALSLMAPAKRRPAIQTVEPPSLLVERVEPNGYGKLPKGDEFDLYIVRLCSPPTSKRKLNFEQLVGPIKARCVARVPFPE